MQKLPEAYERKRGDACAKRKRDRPDKRRKLILFQQWPAEWQHLNLLYCWWKVTWPLESTTLANLSLVAADSVNSMPKYKKYQNGPIELRTETMDLDQLLKATNTLLKL